MFRETTHSGIDFTSLADDAPALIWLSDVQHRGVWFNRRWLAYTGRSLEHELGYGWRAGIHPDDLDRYVAASSAAFDGRRPFEVEYRLRRTDGSHGWIADAGQPRFRPDGEFAGYIGCARDITAQKATERALQESVQHTRAIFDHAVDGIITIDGEGTVRSLNPAACFIFGYPPEEIVGRNVAMLMPEPHRSRHDDYLHAYQASGVPRIIGFGREVEGQRRDGSVFPMELAVSEISQQGRPLYVGLLRDISERKQMEQIKAELVSTVSHELRTPLTAIAGALGLLAGGVLGELPAEARQMVAIANKNSLRLSHLINDLLDLEKLAGGKLRLDLQVQPLMPLVEQTLEAMRAFGAQHQVRFELSRREDALVRVDGVRLQQILTNFLSNAARFSPAGERVEVVVQGRRRAVRVEVADHGPGVPDAFRARIFQKFSRADSQDARGGGSGLGLAISQELAERMNGMVGFSSEPGAGARFFVELPVVEAA